jgi:predicted nucleic acid-binding protein
MKNKYTLDTSFISALLKVDDHFSLEASKMFLEVGDDAIFYLPTPVILELIILSNRRIHQLKQNIKEFIHELDPIIVDINENFIDGFLTYTQENEVTLKPIDASVFFTCFQYKTQLLSFDERLIKVYKSKL